MIVKNASKAVAALAATLTLTTLLGCAHPPGSPTQANFVDIGLIAFNVSVHIPPPVQRVDEDDTGPVSVAATVQHGGGHG